MVDVFFVCLDKNCALDIYLKCEWLLFLFTCLFDNESSTSNYVTLSLALPYVVSPQYQVI